MSNGNNNLPRNTAYGRVDSKPGIDRRKEEQRQNNLTPEQRRAEVQEQRITRLEQRLEKFENQIVEVHGLGAHATSGKLVNGVHIVLPSGANATCVGSNTLQLTFF